MFNKYLEEILSKDFSEGYKLEYIKIELSDWHEATAGNKAIDLEHNVLVVNRLVAVGEINTNANILNNDFVVLKSKNEYQDLKQTIEVSNIVGNIFEIISKYPTKHHSQITINYDLSNFVFDTISKAYLEGVLISKT